MCLLAALMLCASGPLSYGQCTGGVTPLSTGPVNPRNGFPLWVTDSTGLTVGMCMPNSPNCLATTPVIPTNPFSVQTGFGDEGFFYLADATFNIQNGRVRVVMAVEAAYLNGVPAAGEQFPFARLRLRIDPPSFGVFTIEHPYGKDVFRVDTLDAKGKIDRVFVSYDIPLAPATPNQKTRVGPLLRWDPAFPPLPPPGFLSDGVTAHRVVGSPYCTNFVKITGVDLNGKPLNLDGKGGNVVSTNLFNITGQVASRLGAGVTRATYSREAFDPGIELFTFTRKPDPNNETFQNGVSAPIGVQSITASAPGLIATPMTADPAGSGRYFAFFPGDFPPPSSITVTNTSDGPETPGIPESTTTQVLTDNVAIASAYFVRATNTLEVNALSTDQVSTCPGGAKLTVWANDGTKLGDMTVPAVIAVANNGLANGFTWSSVMAIPPPSVTVTSCFGGSATVAVDVGKCERVGNSLKCK